MVNTPRIFVSHSHKDDEFGLRLISGLRARLGEAAVWYDSSGGLHGGDEWWNRIVAEITSRDVFIVIFSPDSVNSKWVIDEINIAWALRHRIGTRIIPVLYRPCDLRADWLLLQSVSFVAPRSFDSAIVELLKILDVPVDQVALPVAIPSVNSSPLAQVIERLTQEIHAAFGQEEWTTVIAKANLLLEEAKEMPPALWRELGLAYVALGDGTAALTALNKALKADQFDVPTLRGKGLASELLGSPEEAIPLLDRAYTLAPFTDLSLRLTLLDDLFRVLTSAQRWDDALRRVQDALRLAPDDTAWVSKQLEMLGHCGRDDDALHLASQLASSQPTLVRQWVAARLEHDRNQVNLGDALRVLDLGIQLAPHDDALLATKLDILVQMGREDRALATAASYVQYNATLADKWLRTRFWAHMQAREWPQALLAADTALRAGFGDVSWAVGKVEALRSMGQVQDAYAFASQTTSQPRYSRDSQAWMALAASAAATDNEAEVRRAIAVLVELDGESSLEVAAARTQFLSPYEKAAAKRAQEATRIEDAKRKNARRRRLTLIGLVVSVVLLGCLAASLLTLNGYRTLQAQAAETAAAGTAAVQQTTEAGRAAVQQTAAVQTAAIQTAVIATAAPSASEISCLQKSDRTGACAHFYRLPYKADAPGKCDKGDAQWIASTSPALSVNCTGNTARLSATDTSTLTELYFLPADWTLSSNYMITITVSDLTSTSDCGGILTNLQGTTGGGGYGYFICGDGSWEIIQYSSSGTPHRVKSGSVVSGGSYYLSASVVADAHIISVGTVGNPPSVGEVYYDIAYSSTHYVALTIQNQSAPSATMSQFSYTPLM